MLATVLASSSSTEGVVMEEQPFELIDVAEQFSRMEAKLHSGPATSSQPKQPARRRLGDTIVEVNSKHNGTETELECVEATAALGSPSRRSISTASGYSTPSEAHSLTHGVSWGAVCEQAKVTVDVVRAAEPPGPSLFSSLEDCATSSFETASRTGSCPDTSVEEGSVEEDLRGWRKFDELAGPYRQQGLKMHQKVAFGVRPFIPIEKEDTSSVESAGYDMFHAAEVASCSSGFPTSFPPGPELSSGSPEPCRQMYEEVDAALPLVDARADSLALPEESICAGAGTGMGEAAVSEGDAAESMQIVTCSRPQQEDSRSQLEHRVNELETCVQWLLEERSRNTLVVPEGYILVALPGSRAVKSRALQGSRSFTSILVDYVAGLWPISMFVSLLCRIEHLTSSTTLRLPLAGKSPDCYTL